MTVTESKGLMKGNRVYWRGDAADYGIVTETSWDAVTIAWHNGEVSDRAPRGYARYSLKTDTAVCYAKVGVISPHLPNPNDV